MPAGVRQQLGGGCRCCWSSRSGGVLHVHSHVAGVLHLEQVDADRHVVAGLNGQLLHELIILAGLSLVGSREHPEARGSSHTWHTYHAWLWHCLGVGRWHLCLGVGTGHD